MSFPCNKLIRPHLEYAMQACSPNLIADANYLERTQRLATRLVKGFRRLSYEDSLRRLGLQSISRRYLRGDFIACLLKDWIWTPAPSLFRQCSKAWDVTFSTFCRVLVGTFAERPPSPYEPLHFGIGSPPLLRRLDLTWNDLLSEIVWFTPPFPSPHFHPSYSTGMHYHLYVIIVLYHIILSIRST